MLASLSALPPWRLRPARPADVPALAALYASVARRLGPACYTPEQVQAWAGFGADLTGFADYVLQADTWVAEADGASPAAGSDDALGRVTGQLGFSGINASGEVKSLYVRHDVMRRGLASQLLAQGLTRGQALGIRHFTAWATPFSLPVFRRAGFALLERVLVPFGGTMFERLRVAR